MGEIVQLEAPDGHRFSGYAALPDAEPQGCIVVGMEIYGVNGYLRSVCDDFAQAGYVSLAPALFDRFSPASPMNTMTRAAGPARSCPDGRITQKP